MFTTHSGLWQHIRRRYGGHIVAVSHHWQGQRSYLPGSFVIFSVPPALCQTLPTAKLAFLCPQQALHIMSLILDIIFGTPQCTQSGACCWSQKPAGLCWCRCLGQSDKRVRQCSPLRNSTHRYVLSIKYEDYSSF